MNRNLSLIIVTFNETKKLKYLRTNFLMYGLLEVFGINYSACFPRTIVSPVWRHDFLLGLARINSKEKQKHNCSKINKRSTPTPMFRYVSFLHYEICAR